MNALTKDFTDAVEQQFSKLNSDVQSALKKAGTVEGILQELEQKMACSSYGGGATAPESWGQQVVDSDQVKSLAGIATSQPGRVKIELKEITSIASSGGSLDGGMRDSAINSLPVRQPRIRDLLNVLNTTSGNVEYVDQTTRDNQAAPQVEGALKEESSYAWELKNLPIRTIAHWTKASVQILADAPQLQSVIDTELRYGLALAEETQLLNGDGVSPNLDGLITNATAYVADFTPTTETMIDKVGLGMLQVTLADYVPNGVVMHPSDWMRIRLLKNTDGEYLLGDPQSNPNPLLFGLPVVATTAIAKDAFLVGDFRRAATLYDREQANVALSTEDGDNFVKNMVTIRAEERLGLAVKNATAMSLGDFGNVT
ncbi:phage major capsid protein [Tsuneonella troitsensis]|uniref:phage major capsid protein n=1 Tax=Tsuneonella troitsensis TaxID=292222 RepID=UPI00070CD4A7|nr:phage major capsid protein [Tsuneonella troitsensis]